MPSTKLVASDALPVFWSLRGVVGTRLNEIMPEEEARRLQRFYVYKGAYLVSSIDGVSWTPETNVGDVTQKLGDTVLLDFLQQRWARVEMLGDPIGDSDESCWEVTPERYNPAYTGQAGTLREAIRDAIRKNSTERPE
jgi:hypothetical protein